MSVLVSQGESSSRCASRCLALLGVLVVAALVLSVVGVSLVRRSFPQTEGEITLPGLAADVDVLRDERGIPQIYGDSLTDIAKAQGFVHAQDRFFEMDLRRHVTAGRLSELVGDAGVETDKVVRTMGWRRIAEAELPTLDPQTRTYLQAYADGVNAYLRGRSPSQASLEYVVLGTRVSDYRIEKWTPADSIAWLKAMAWDLRGDYSDELARARLSDPRHRQPDLRDLPALRRRQHADPLRRGLVPAARPRARVSSSVPAALSAAATGASAGSSRTRWRSSPAQNGVCRGGPCARRRPRAHGPGRGHRVELVGRRAGEVRDRQAPARQRPAPLAGHPRDLVPGRPALPREVRAVPSRRRRLLVLGRPGRRHRPQRQDRVGVHQPRPGRQRLLPREGRR